MTSTKFALTLAGLLALLALNAAYEQSANRSTSSELQSIAERQLDLPIDSLDEVNIHIVTMNKLKSGNSRQAAYAYQDDGGSWWYYFLSSDSSDSAANSDNCSLRYGYTTAKGVRVTLPSGRWSRGSTAPKAEEIESQEEEVSVAESPEGPVDEDIESDASSIH